MESIEPLVEGLHGRLSSLLTYLKDDTDPSDSTDLKSVFTKYFVVSAASYFESFVLENIHVALETENNRACLNFINNKALKRQYHSLFKWDGKNVNTFLGLFGEEISKLVNESVKGNSEYTQGMADFLFLGNLRNELVHKRLADFSTDITLDEAKGKFSRALVFTTILFAEIIKAIKPAA